MKEKIFLLFNLTVITTHIFSQTDSVPGKTLRSETMLHPGECFTAYTYKKGEWFYAQTLVPYPGFSQFGATDRLTIELPFWEWLGGVVSINGRFSLSKQNGLKPALAYETQYQYISNEIDLLENRFALKVLRKGNNWFNRINASWKLNEQLYLHLSGGGTYAEFLSFENPDSTNYQNETYVGKITPDVSLGIDWRTARWITFSSSVSYGSTYMYIDNVARKKQYTLATRIAPFIAYKKQILNGFRL